MDVKKEKQVISGPVAPTLPNISVGLLMIDIMRKNPYHYAQVDTYYNKCIMNKDILVDSVKLASILRARGVNMQDKIATASENSFKIISVAAASWYIGAVYAPMNPLYTEREYRHLLEIIKPKVMFVTRRTEEILCKIAPTLSWTMQIIQLDDESRNKDITTLKQLLESCINFPDPYEFQPVKFVDNSKQIAVTLCSSGTTGLPKWVALSHKNVLSFLLYSSNLEVLDIHQNDRILMFLPMYHGYAFCAVIMGLVTGATVVIMESFNLQVFLKSIEKYRVTHLMLVPSVLVMLAKYPPLGDYDLSSVREVLCGAAPLPKHLIDEVKKRMKCSSIRNGYGMTELSVLASVSDRSPNSAETVGFPVPNIHCKVVDQTTQETLGAGQIGELCFKGEQVMMGYYNNPKATAETIDKDGWLHSGDYGYYDKDGKMHVTGRLKELIKYKAYQVAPSEIETVLLSHPDVKDAAVIGKPDETAGELPMAFIVRQPGSQITGEEIVTYVKKNLSPQKWLRGGVKFIDAIPKNHTGKILRSELQKMLSKL